MKERVVRRQLDGKLYAVLGERKDGAEILIRHPSDGGQMWIQAEYTDDVPEPPSSEQIIR